MNRKTWTIAATLLLTSLTVGTAQAQTARGGDDQAFQFRIGVYFPDGGGPLWNDIEDRFTLEVDDFNGGMIGFSFINSFGNRVEFGLNADFYGETVLSEDREFVDTDGFPILHDTTLRVAPLTVDVRLVPGGRYRIRPGGAHVLKPVFYVGAGAGMMLWSYEEKGDFVDENDPLFPIFFDQFEESGVALETHVLAGLEFPVGPRVNLTLEGRYA